MILYLNLQTFMFVETEAYLVSVSEQLDLTMVYYLKSIESSQAIKSVSRLGEAILSHISTYWSEDFSIISSYVSKESNYY